jgi:hypothetical protein
LLLLMAFALFHFHSTNYQYQSSSTSIKIMMCILLEITMLLQCHSGKVQCMNQPLKFSKTYKWIMSIYFFNFKYIYIYIYIAKKDSFASKENYLYWSWNDYASIFSTTSIELQWITHFYLLWKIMNMRPYEKL